MPTDELAPRLCNIPPINFIAMVQHLFLDDLPDIELESFCLS